MLSFCFGVRYDPRSSLSLGHFLSWVYAATGPKKAYWFSMLCDSRLGGWHFCWWLRLRWPLNYPLSWVALFVRTWFWSYFNTESRLFTRTCTLFWRNQNGSVFHALGFDHYGDKVQPSCLPRSILSLGSCIKWYMICTCTVLYHHSSRLLSTLTPFIVPVSISGQFLHVAHFPLSNSQAKLSGKLNTNSFRGSLFARTCTKPFEWLNILLFNGLFFSLSAESVAQT